MPESLQLHSTDPIIRTINFQPYRNAVERRAKQFLPGPGEPQEMKVRTPWGETLTADYGDFIVSESDQPDDRWPVTKEIFEKTYMETKPGYYVKRPLNRLAPLTDFTNNPDRMVTVHTLEGEVTVRAGDFYLARGVRGEIWPIPAEKVHNSMQRVEDQQTETIYNTESFSLERDDRGNIFAIGQDEVLALPLTEHGTVLLSREYSPAFGKPLLILCGGRIEPENEMTDTLNRELQEELGFRAECFTPIGSLLPFSKYLRVTSYIFLVQDLAPSKLEGDDYDCDICIEEVHFDSFEELIAEGKLQDARTIAALYMLRKYLDDHPING